VLVDFVRGLRLLRLFWGVDGFAYIGADVVILRNGGHCRCLCGYAFGWSVILEFAKGSEVDGRTMLTRVL
jgi:hypothetical protein